MCILIQFPSGARIGDRLACDRVVLDDADVSDLDLARVLALAEMAANATRDLEQLLDNLDKAKGGV